MPTGKVSPALSVRVVATTAGATMPAWAAAIAAGTWGAASTNNFFSVATGAGDFANILQDYNGAAVVPPGDSGYSKGALLFHGGGHADAGMNNALVAFNASTRLFEIVEAPYAGPFNNGGAGTYPESSYPDGSPVPPHTYCYPGFDPVNRQYYNPRGVTSYTASTQAAQTSQGFVFDLASGNWRRARRNTGFDGQYANGGRTVWDSRRGHFWTMTCSGSPSRLVVKASNLHVANGDGTYGAALENTPYTDSSGTESDAVFLRHPTDADQDLIVYTRFPASGSRRLHGVPIVGNIPRARIDLTFGGDVPTNLSRKAALMWSPRRQSILYYDNAQPDPVGSPAGSGRAIIYEIVAPTSPDNWKTGTWTFRLLTGAANTYLPPSAQASQGDGIYSKARLLTYSDGEIVVAVPAHNAPAAAFRVP